MRGCGPPLWAGGCSARLPRTVQQAPVEREMLSSHGVRQEGAARRAARRRLGAHRRAARVGRKR
eukprot:6561735-Prymnesium_polylepis.1